MPRMDEEIDHAIMNVECYSIHAATRAASPGVKASENREVREDMLRNWKFYIYIFPINHVSRFHPNQYVLADWPSWLKMK